MKLKNFKITLLMLLGIALFVLNGCGGTTGTSSDSQLVGGGEEQCLIEAGGYGTIEINGRTWLDRNLGASETAAELTDSLAYGDLYQWGRAADGHQERASNITNTLASTLDGSDVNTAWYGMFIATSTSINDWVASAVDDNGDLRAQSWSNPYDETTNPNQICPCGYVVPSAQDFLDLNLTDPVNLETFNLAYAGGKFPNGTLTGEDTLAVFWTSESDNITYAKIIKGLPIQILEMGYRADGLSVRCIKP